MGTHVMIIMVVKHYRVCGTQIGEAGASQILGGRGIQYQFSVEYHMFVTNLRSQKEIFQCYSLFFCTEHVMSKSRS